MVEWARGKRVQLEALVITTAMSGAISLLIGMIGGLLGGGTDEPTFTVPISVSFSLYAVCAVAMFLLWLPESYEMLKGE